MAHPADKSNVSAGLGGRSTWMPGTRFGVLGSEDELVITIGQIPQILQPFWDALRPRFSKRQSLKSGPYCVTQAVPMYIYLCYTSASMRQSIR